MTACWNAAVRCERRSSGVCRHGPPEPARGPSRSLQDSGRQPAPATLSAHGRASRPSSSLELSVKERQPHGCQEFPVGFASIADTDGLQPLGACRQELLLARAEAATQAVRHPLISRAGPVTSLVQGQPPAWCCIRSFREQGLPPAWCRATTCNQHSRQPPATNDRAGQWGCRERWKGDLRRAPRDPRRRNAWHRFRSLERALAESRRPGGRALGEASLKGVSLSCVWRFRDPES